MNILEIELLSDDLQQTEAFYRKVLGLEPYFKEDNQLMFFKIGATELIFKKSENQKPVYHFAIDVPNNRFDEAHSFFRHRTHLINLEDGTDIANFINWQAKSFYFFDNNGNIVEIITRYPNRVIDDKPFTDEAYLNISEISMVVPSVPEMVQILGREYGIPVYKRQPEGKRFSVCGDDNGLFVVAESGREWFPTDSKARHFNTRILYLNQGALFHLIL